MLLTDRIMMRSIRYLYRRNGLKKVFKIEKFAGGPKERDTLRLKNRKFKMKFNPLVPSAYGRHIKNCSAAGEQLVQLQKDPEREPAVRVRAAGME